MRRSERDRPRHGHTGGEKGHCYQSGSPATPASGGSGESCRLSFNVVSHCLPATCCLVFYGLQFPVPTGIRVWHTYITRQDTVQSPELPLHSSTVGYLCSSRKHLSCVQSTFSLSCFPLMYPVLEDPVVPSFIVCVAQLEIL